MIYTFFFETSKGWRPLFWGNEGLETIFWGNEGLETLFLRQLGAKDHFFEVTRDWRLFFEATHFPKVARGWKLPFRDSEGMTSTFPRKWRAVDYFLRQRRARDYLFDVENGWRLSCWGKKKANIYLPKAIKGWGLTLWGNKGPRSYFFETASGQWGHDQAKARVNKGPK